MTTRHEHRRMREASVRVAKALRTIAADLPNLSAQAADPLYDLFEHNGMVRLGESYGGMLRRSADEIEEKGR